MLEKYLRSLEESQTSEPTVELHGIDKWVAWTKSIPTRIVGAFTGKQAHVAIILSSVVILGSAFGVSALVKHSLNLPDISKIPVSPSGSLGKEGADSASTNQPGASNSTSGSTGTKQTQPGASNSTSGSGSNTTSSGTSSGPAGQSPVVNPPTPPNDTVKAFLARHTVGTLHEAIPHGVPTNHEHRTKAVLKNPAPPNAEMTYINIRGAVYVDESNYRAPNTRVEIINCQTYGLKQATNAWEKLIDLSPGKLAGKGWHEDFSTPGDAMYTNIRTEASGSKSVINYDGYNLHFFNNTNLAPLVYVGYNYSEFVTGCSTRLILEDPNGPDNRASSAYIITTGNDWKKADNTCTVNQSGATLCYAIGAGRYIKATSNWRRVVYSSLDSADLNSKPMPPDALFRNPDGSFGD